MLRFGPLLHSEPMPEAGERVDFVLSLRPCPGGSPSGTLRAVGDQNETPFDGWIGLIGLITELGFDAGGSRGAGEGSPFTPWTVDEGEQP